MKNILKTRCESSAKKNVVDPSSYFDASVIERESKVAAVTDWRI